MIAFEARDFSTALNDWWAVARIDRDELPWRSTRDAWQVLVSEVMLSQTQVRRVAPIFGEFVVRFPDPARCADALLGEVLRIWSGLGYNRRAAQLHACAVRIVEGHGGVVPDRLEELLELPGVGPYIARAVSSFAYGARVGVLDTNIGRVLARAVAGARLGRADAQRLADDLVPADHSREWNLALMDFGALVCTSREPHCANCPIRGACAWRRGPATAPDPAIGSAGVSGRQSRFEGSDRQGRGNLLRAACAGAIEPGRIAEVCGWPDNPSRSLRVATSLVTEGLLRRREDGAVHLP